MRKEWAGALPFCRQTCECDLVIRIVIQSQVTALNLIAWRRRGHSVPYLRVREITSVMRITRSFVWARHAFNLDGIQILENKFFGEGKEHE